MSKSEKYMRLAVQNGHAKSCKCPKCGKWYLKYKVLNWFKDSWKHDCMLALGIK